MCFKGQGKPAPLVLVYWTISFEEEMVLDCCATRLKGRDNSSKKDKRAFGFMVFIGFLFHHHYVALAQGLAFVGNAGNVGAGRQPFQAEG
jgi:hypothetical protein